MAVIGPRFTLKGLAPPEVALAPRADRAAFWAAAAAFVVEAKDDELRRGLDRLGNPMAPLARSTIVHRRSAMGPADPHAPPLQPAHGHSRTRSLFTAQPTASLDGVTCWWAYDRRTGASWGEVLRHHKRGGRRLPVRDVIGMAPASLAVVARKCADWWVRYKVAKVAVPSPARELLPSPLPRSLIEAQRAYRPRVAANAAPAMNRRVSQIRINGHTYTLQGGSAAQIRRSIANGTFSGFGRVTPLPGSGGGGTGTARPLGRPPWPPSLPRPAAAVANAANRLDRMAAPRRPTPVGPDEPARWRKQMARLIGSHGIAVERDGHEAIRRADGRRAAGRIVAAYDPSRGKVFLNQRHPFWRSPIAFMTTNHRAGSTSTANPAHPAFQEIAHRLHQVAVGAARYAELRARPLTPEEDAIAATVSAYARTSPAEFVAEVYAALRDGRELDEAVLALYNRLGGPVP